MDDFKNYTFDDIVEISEKCHDPLLLKKTLQYIFSFPEQIHNFGKFFFKDAIQGNVPDFHKEIYQMLVMQNNTALAAPRGHAKSTITGLVFVTWCIVNRHDRYIVYVSQNHSKTVQFLEPLHFNFKENEILRFVYGDLSPKGMEGDDGRDREDCLDIAGIRVEAVSFEKNLRGFKYLDMRPTLIILDDIEEDERVMNPMLRVKDSNKLNKVIIPSLDINGRIKFIGTLLHYDSLLSKKISQYSGKIYRAISQDGIILWPERFTKEKLDAIKSEIGEVPFQQEYLNDPMDNVSSVIRRDWIVQCLDDSLSAVDLMSTNYDIKTLGVDFAFGDKVINDKSAFVSIGLHREKYYVFQISTSKGMSVLEQLDYIRDGLHLAHRYTYVGLEENSIKSITKNISQWNLPLKLFWTAANDPANKLRVDQDFQAKRYTIGKVNMLHRLAALFQTGKFVIPYKTESDRMRANELITECTSYSLQDGKLIEATVHPDIPIALGYAVEAIQEHSRVVTVW